MSIIDNWINRIAKKEFAQTINWIDALVVFLLGLLLTALILLDTTPVDISVPIKVAGTHTLIMEQDYIESITHKKKVYLKYKEQPFHSSISSTTFMAPHHVVIKTLEPIPYPKNTTVRLILFRKTILDMLLRTKSFGKK